MIYPTLRSAYNRVSGTTVYRIRLIECNNPQQVLTPEEWDSGITAEDEDIQEEDKEGELAEGELEAHEEVEEEEEEVASVEAATSRSRSCRRLNMSFRSVEEGYY